LLAKRIAASPAFRRRWMEEVCGRDNCRQALERAKANRDFLKERRLAIRKQFFVTLVAETCQGLGEAAPKRRAGGRVESGPATRGHGPVRDR